MVKQGDWLEIFAVGFHDEDTAQIGIARSRDGVTNWQRHPANPIISSTKGNSRHTNPL